MSVLVAATAFGVMSFGLAGLGSVQAQTPPAPEPAAGPTLNFEFYDFFNVPYGPWWDYRFVKYGDLPMNAECFNQVSVADGTCKPVNANVPDVSSYPYANWYPFPGALQPGHQLNNPAIYAPYRFRATGTEIPGYSLAEPVFLPVQNPAAAAGTSLDFNWYMQYLTKTDANALAALGCPVTARSLDGFHLRSQATLVMDLQESRRLFGVVAADSTAAQRWWNDNTDPTCLGEGAAETTLATWYSNQGGGNTLLGTYDIVSSFEYYYYPWYTQVKGTVAADGTTTVEIDHVAWGTEVLFSRWFYWGSASYAANYLDSTKAKGWWGMELAWFEDFTFSGSLFDGTMDFRLSSAMQYHLTQYAFANANGHDRVDDVPYWEWGPVLGDYTNDWSPHHLISELDRYVGLDGTPCNADDLKYVHTWAGSIQYGKNLCFDSVPLTWNLKAGETWHFTFPTGDVRYYDPNLTPLGANPRLGQYVEYMAPLTYHSTNPAGYGMWNPVDKTWQVTGPTNTGGPDGSPGNYALSPWSEIRLTPGNALLRVTTNPAVAGKIIVDGVARDEWGLTWMKIAPGPHTVTFSDLAGLSPPGPTAVNTVRGATTEVQGNYQVNGFLRVLTNPAVPGTVFVNGAPNNDWGMWREAAPGTYTVSFGPVADFTPPAPQVVQVNAGATTTVIGQYTASPGAPGRDPNLGEVRVTTNPAVAATILIDGVPRDDWGLTWLDLPAGTYTVSFTGVYGVTAPPPTQLVVTAGQTTVYDAQFTVHGSLRVTTNPAVPATIFVDGIARNDWGMWQSMEPGSYTVQFEPIVGFTSPAVQTVSVTSGALTQVVGNYVAVSVTPDAAGPTGPAFLEPDAGTEPVAAAVPGSSRD